VAAGIGLMGGAVFGGLYLGLTVRDLGLTAQASLPAEQVTTVVADMSASNTVNLRFPADWSESAATPKLVAFASSDGEITLFNPQPTYPIEGAAAPPAAESFTALKSASATPPPNTEQPAGQSKIVLASASSRSVIAAPKPKSNSVLSDSQIASIKRRLNLSPDQERYWPAVEAELRKMEYKKGQGTRTASVDMSKVNVEGLKSAGFPLVMSFSDDQRRELKSLAHLLGLENVMSGI
jgi:hypothetical protein